MTEKSIDGMSSYTICVENYFFFLLQSIVVEERRWDLGGEKKLEVEDFYPG